MPFTGFVRATTGIIALSVGSGVAASYALPMIDRLNGFPPIVEVEADSRSDTVRIAKSSEHADTRSDVLTKDNISERHAAFMYEWNNHSD
jgi:hypothetical protein